MEPNGTKEGVMRPWIIGRMPNASVRQNMQELSTRQRVLLRAIVVLTILILLAIFGVISRGPAIVQWAFFQKVGPIPP